MFVEGLEKYLTNPIIAILPFAIYIILQQFFMPVEHALIIALSVSVVTELLLKFYFKTNVYGFPFYIMTFTFMVMALCWLFGDKHIQNDYAYIVIGEVVLIVLLIATRIGRSFIRLHFFRERPFLARALINDYYITLILLKYAFLGHVLAVFLYKEITGGYSNSIVDQLVYVSIPVAIIVILLFYQFFKTKYLVKKLSAEEWLPIVSEDGQVKGKIARSVSRNMGNKHMHPVVRIALICGDKIYLQERENSCRIDPKKIDYPFEKYILFKHGILEAANNSIINLLGRTFDEEPEFILKYVFENEFTKRLVFLFIAKVNDESEIAKSGKMKGKFWTTKQIDEEFESGIFSEPFELEYEYLKHMILLDDANDTLICPSQHSEICGSVS